jgi:hypothetical protein
MITGFAKMRLQFNRNLMPSLPMCEQFGTRRQIARSLIYEPGFSNPDFALYIAGTNTGYR